MLFEVTGLNHEWMLTHAESPTEACTAWREAFDNFQKHHPNSDFLSIQEVRPQFEAIDQFGDQVIVLRSRWLKVWNRRRTNKRLVLHYETNCDRGSWIPASQFQALEAVA